MAPKPPTLSKPSFKEVRTTGRQADIVYLTTRALENILTYGGCDIYNSVEAFNKFEGSVETLISVMAPYYDIRFNLDYEITNEFPAVMLNDAVDLMRDRLRIICKLMKRKGFLPTDDVESEPYILLAHIKERVNNKLDALVGVQGDRGSGKTYTALWLAQELDKSFTLKRVFFNADNFRAMLEKERYPIGSTFIWDEATAGRGLNKRQSMTTDNIEFNQILQVIRKRRYIVLFTLPNMEQIDGASLDYFGGKIEPIYIDEEKKICLIKYQDRKKGSGGKDYWPYMTAPTGERITSIPIPKIDEEIAKDYEDMKDIFLDSIISRKRKRRHGKKLPDLKAFAEEVKPILDQLKGDKGTYNTHLVQNKYQDMKGEELGRPNAERVIAYIKEYERKQVEEVPK
jgi:hypothetical protein